MEEAEIIRQVLAGHHEQYAFFVKRYQEPLIRFLRRLLISEEDALDCAQEAFLAAYKNLWRYSEKYTFRAWLYTIARNKALDVIRKRRREGSSVLEETLADVSPGPEEQWLEKEKGLRIQKILEEIPEHYRNALYLRYKQELTYEEIALVLQVPVSRVKTYLHRGKIKLRQRMREDESYGKLNGFVDPTVSR